MTKHLYVIITDIDENNINSGPSVRSLQMLKAYRKVTDCDVIMSSSAAGRLKQFMDLIKQKVEYDYCYIESKVGITRFQDSLLLLLLKWKFRNIKIGLFYRDMYWNYNIKMSEGAIKNLLVPIANKIYLKFLSRLFNVLFCPSQRFKEQLQKFTSNKCEIEILPPGCDDIEVEEVRNNEVIYVGEIDMEFSGIKMLISALEIANREMEVILNLVCRVEEYKKNVFLQNMNEKFTWLKITHHNKKNIAEIYNKSGLSIIPRSNNEYMKISMPLKLFEYISYQKPIIAINYGEVGEFILNNEVGLVSEDSEQSLAQKIIMTLSNDNIRANFRNNLIKYKQQNLWTSRVSVIDSVLKGR